MGRSETFLVALPCIFLDLAKEVSPRTQKIPQVNNKEHADNDEKNVHSPVSFRATVRTQLRVPPSEQPELADRGNQAAVLAS